MKFDVTLLSFDLADIPTYAQAAEALGFDGFWLAETQADPFLGLVLAAEHTQRMALGSGIAVAFPRSPTVTAMMAWNIAKMANGRFHLGLGSQVKAHNVLRYGVASGKNPSKKCVKPFRPFVPCGTAGRRANRSITWASFSSCNS